MNNIIHRTHCSLHMVVEQRGREEGWEEKRKLVLLINVMMKNSAGQKVVGGKKDASLQWLVGKISLNR